MSRLNIRGKKLFNSWWFLFSCIPLCLLRVAWCIHITFILCSVRCAHISRSISVDAINDDPNWLFKNVSPTQSNFYECVCVHVWWTCFHVPTKCRGLVCCSVFDFDFVSFFRFQFSTQHTQCANAISKCLDEWVHYCFNIFRRVVDLNV